jgi:hypothetical protein
MSKKIISSILSRYLIINVLLSISMTSVSFAADPSSNPDQETIANSEDVVPEYKERNNMIGFEGLGRGLLYSLYYERALDHRVSLGGGVIFHKYGYSVPLYANIFLNQNENAYLTAGALFLSPETYLNETNKQAKVMSVMPTVGIGIQKIFSNDSFFRATLYGIALNGPIPLAIPWVGASFGKVF